MFDFKHKLRKEQRFQSVGILGFVSISKRTVSCATNLMNTFYQNLNIFHHHFSMKIPYK